MLGNSLTKIARVQRAADKPRHVTDCSCRTFFEISCFEYALWAFDKHMWTLMLECIAHDMLRNFHWQIVLLSDVIQELFYYTLMVNIINHYEE